MKGYFSLILTHLISPLGGEKIKAEVVYLPENKRRRNVTPSTQELGCQFALQLKSDSGQN